MSNYMAQIKAFLIKRKWYVLAALGLLLIIGGVLWNRSGSDASAVVDDKPVVKVGRVSDLMQGGNSLSIVAEIRSINEAKISTEAGGRVTRVSASLGDFVAAGQVLAEVENSSQRAAVLQADGALDAAKAASPNIATSLDSAKATAVTTLLSAYAAADNTVRNTSDAMFSNPSSRPQFNVSTADSQAKLDLENTRPQLTIVLQREAAQSSTLTNDSDLDTELTTTEGELRTIRAFLDTLIKALNAGITSPTISDTTIATYVANATAARTAITASLSAINAAQSGLVVAKNNAEGTGSNNVSASSAALKQAQGAYNAALAALEKTIIRSPISGSLNNFTIKLGDYLVPSQEVAVVSNNGALEAVAYVTEEDRARIAVGQKVNLEGVTGTVTRIAPALDPVTRRIEVRIGLPSGSKTLTNGQSVRVELTSSTTVKPLVGPLSIPITALKIEAQRTIVFTVENGKIVSKEIAIGKLSGDSVQVTAGLTADTEIVADARGLKDGDEVTIAQ